MDFWRAANVLARRKWMILLSTVVATLLTFGATALIGSKWKATVRLIQPKASVFANLNSKGTFSDSGSDIPTVGPYAKEAAKDQASIYEAMTLSNPVIRAALTKLRGKLAMTPNLLEHINVNAENSRLYDLEVTESNPATAQDLANGLAVSLVEYNRRVNTDSDRRAVALLEKQVKHADEMLAATRRKYDQVCEQYKILATPTSNMELILARLREARQAQEALTDRLADVQAQKGAKEAELAGQPLTVPVKSPAQLDPRIAHFQSALDQKELDLTILRAKYADGHPLVRGARNERDALEASLKAEIAKQKSARRTEDDVVMQPNPRRDLLQQELAFQTQQISGVQAQLTKQNAAVQAAENEIHQLKPMEGPLAPLSAQLSEETDARSNLIARLNGARIAMDAAERQNTLAIMDPVSDSNPPLNTTAGRTIKLIIMAVICALLLTSGLVIALDSIDRRLKTVHEAELVLPGRVLAAIPQPAGPVSYESLARITALHPQSLHAEAYRFLGMHLLNPRGPRARSLMVLAAKAEQGSTSTVTNLGITLAQAGQRVVIVDANVRTPEIHQVFELPNDFGFTDLLRNPSTESWKRAVRSTTVDNLHVITSGTTPDNPWELMRSPNLAQVSAQLHEIADYVLYDTPSALVFTDALNLAPVVDAAFLCVRALEPLTGAEQRLIELLEQANVTVLGNVVSHVPMEVVESSHNYQHYYIGSMPAGAASTTAALPPPREDTR